MRDVLMSVAMVVAVALPAAAETRALSGFSVIHVSEGIQLEIAQGDAYSVTVEGRDAADIVTNVQGQRLNITRRGLINFGPGPSATVHVTLPRLDALHASSGVEVTASDLAGESLELELSQGAIFEAEHIRVGALNIEASQGGMATIGGTCTSVTARASMGGVIEADKLECSTATASASMGGTVEIHAKQSVDASASMGGAIDVVGSPAQRHTSAGMGGEIDIN